MKGRHPGGAFLLLLVLFPALLLYLGGLSGAFRLDDLPNLQRLASGDTDLLAFVFGGPVGGSGRPLSYLSFYLQRADYPDNPAAFLWVNLGIHLFNTLLVLWLVAGLARARKIASPWWLAAGVALLWSILPVHVSTVLYVVQRMTLLSATFVLLGCAGYVHARLRLREWNGRGAWLLTFWVGLAYLGVFAKENAILAGLGLACIEYFFFWQRRPVPGRLWRYALFLGPFVAVAFYLLAIKGVYLHYGSRDFTLGERLLSEARILWDYLKIVLLPDFNDLGLYHDDFPISRGWGAREIAALLGWGIVILGIAWRRRWRLWPVSFALSWFLLLHLLEATVIPLELYFEHRNYLPAVGLAIGLGLVWWQLLGGVERTFYRRLLQLLGILYLGWLGALTLLEARAWGDPARFVAEAVYKHPDSLRAMEELAAYAVDQGNFQAAYRLHEQWKQQHPERYTPGLDLRILMLSCYDPSIPFEWNEALAERFRSGPPDKSVDVLQDVLDRAVAGQCAHLNLEQYVDLIDSLLANPRYGNDGRTAPFLRKFKATALLALQRPHEALSAVLQGTNLERVDFDYLLLAATLAYEADDRGTFERVLKVIARRRPPDFLLGEGQRDLLQRLERARGQH